VAEMMMRGVITEVDVLVKLLKMMSAMMRVAKVGCEPVGVKTSVGVIVSARVGVKVRSSNKRKKYKIIKRSSL
jgi:hypothetical protein